MPELETIGEIQICQNETDGGPVSLRRVPEEVVCLGYDPAAGKLVEVHVAGDKGQFKSGGHLSFMERGWNAAVLESPVFQRVTAVGEDDGLLFYVTAINEGEYLTDYLVRNGPVPLVTAVGLVLDLIEGLVEIEPHYRLLLGLKFGHVMLVLNGNAYLQLRILDLGIARPESHRLNEFETTQVLAEVSRLLFYLITGRPYKSAQADQIEKLALPDDLASFLKDTINPETCSIGTFETAGERLQAVFQEIAEGSSWRNSRVASPETRPRLTLQREVYDKIETEEQLKKHGFVFDPPSKRVFEFPYSRNAVLDGKPGRLILLPGPKIVPETPKDPGLGEGNGFYWLFRNKSNGISLRELLIRRGHKPPVIESILILDGLAERLDAKAMAAVPISTDQVWLDVPKKSSAEVLQLAEQQIDEWNEGKIFVSVLPITSTENLVSSDSPLGEIPADQILRMSFLRIAGEVLEGCPGTVRDFLDQKVEGVQNNAEGTESCTAILIAIADFLDAES
ncbi:MAG: hypothetical protein HKN23_04010 [Verrucomicrobiales bacterium]|nr:hypothetical protein [Verrucomicrobiales bacterium]